jgi:hypothetical protein
MERAPRRPVSRVPVAASAELWVPAARCPPQEDAATALAEPLEPGSSGSAPPPSGPSPPRLSVFQLYDTLAAAAAGGWRGAAGGAARDSSGAAPAGAGPGPPRGVGPPGPVAVSSSFREDSDGAAGTAGGGELHTEPGWGAAGLGCRHPPPQAAHARDPAASGPGHAPSVQPPPRQASGGGAAASLGGGARARGGGGLAAALRRLAASDVRLGDPATVSRLKKVLETYTDVTRYPPPRRCDAAVIVAAVSDAYVDTSSVRQLHAVRRGGAKRGQGAAFWARGAGPGEWQSSGGGSLR